MHELVQAMNGEAKTTSLKIAEEFNKNHRDVIKAIKNIDCSEEFKLRNFALLLNTNNLSKNKSYYYEITKDGFVFLAMGFRGKKAAVFKENYIAAFNSIAEELYNTKVIKLESMTRSLEAECIKRDSMIGFMQSNWAPVDPEGTISEFNGKPRQHLVHSYYRSDNRHLKTNKTSDLFPIDR